MWIAFGLIASALWGLTYTLSEKIYAQISIPTSLGISSLISSLVVLVYAALTGRFFKDLSVLSNNRGLIWLLVFETLALSLAEIFIGMSIITKNATLAGLIEISYPIFIALFAYLLFREDQVNLSTAIGSVLIFSGIFVIYHFNK